MGEQQRGGKTGLTPKKRKGPNAESRIAWLLQNYQNIHAAKKNYESKFPHEKVFAVSLFMLKPTDTTGTILVVSELDFMRTISPKLSVTLREEIQQRREHYRKTSPLILVDSGGGIMRTDFSNMEMRKLLSGTGAVFVTEQDL